MRLLISFIFCVSGASIAFSQTDQKPGSIHPNVVTLPIEHAGDFKEGFATIKNGDACALIDATGKIVIPFGKYIEIQGFMHGLCVVKNAQWQTGVIDKSFNLIVPFGAYLSGPDADGYCLYTNPADKKLYYINSRGNKIAHVKIDRTDAPSFYNLKTFEFFDGLAIKPVQTLVNGMPQNNFGFINRAGKVVIPIKYSRARNFSEGLAAVAKRDEFGKDMWGYIDKNGNEVVPFMFSIEPGDFHSGRAYVIPKEKTQYAYGYINRKGMMVSAIPKGDKEGSIIDHVTNDPAAYRSLIDFQNGYAVIDFIDFQKGSLKIIDTLNQAREFPAGFHSAFNQLQISDGFFNANGAIYDVKAGLVIPKDVFKNIGPFDPVSHLAAFSTYKADGKHVMGYINKQGVIVIMNKQETSKW